MDSMTSEGTLGGRPVVFAYHCGAKGEQESALRWKRRGSEEGKVSLDVLSSATWEEIPVTQVIGTLGTSTSTPGNDVVLLLAVPNGKAEGEKNEEDGSRASNGEKKSCPVRFEAHPAKNLPAAFHDAFRLDHPRDHWPSPSSQGQSPNIHVVVSTGSGTGLAKKVYQDFLLPLLTYLDLVRGKDYAVHWTTSAASVWEFTRQTLLPRAREGERQMVLLLSGDGGIVDTVNALLERGGQHPSSSNPCYINPTIALLPLGTGNALANTCGLCDDGTLGMRAALRGVPRGVPLFRAIFSPRARAIVDEGRGEEELLDHVDSANGGPPSPIAHGAVVCSWCFHAALVADSDTAAYRVYGAQRFRIAGKEALFPSDGGPPHVYRGKVEVKRRRKLEGKEEDEGEWEVLGGEDSEDGHGYVLATLMKYLEKGFTISPSSTPLDGRLWLVRFGAVSGADAMQLMTCVYKGGTHIDDSRVWYEEVSALRIHVGEDDARWRRLCIDGKIVCVEKGGWVEVHAGAAAVVDVMVNPAG